MSAVESVSGEVVPVERAELLFDGAGPEQILALAADVATRFSDVVRRQGLSQRIAGRDHVLVEGWQTLGGLVKVFAVKDADVGVRELPWPKLVRLWSEPERPGPEPKKASPEYPAWEEARNERKRWEHHRDLLRARDGGLAYGYVASFHAITQDGRTVGWGEGMCTRGEDAKELDDDHSLRSMAQTRGQSRTLSAPLRWLVKLAGYATTPAEEMPPGAAGEPTGGESERVAELERQLQVKTDEYEAARTRVRAAQPVLDEEAIGQVAADLQQKFSGLDGHGFMRVLGRRFPEGIPEPAGVALRAWAWWADRPEATGSVRAQEAPDAAREGAAETAARGAGSSGASS